MSRPVFEKLGYDPARERLLILHADDVGMCHSVNEASFERLGEGLVSSASIMVPCPWALEAVEFFKKNQLDVGVHSTLTSEWRWYKWRPLTRARGLCDAAGFMYPDVRSVAASATAEEVEAELEAQVRWSQSLGLKLSHLDTHMGVIYARPDFFRAYIEVAERCSLLPMVPKPRREILDWGRRAGLPVDELVELFGRAPFALDLLVPGLVSGGYEVKKRFLLTVLYRLEPGTVSQVIVHLGLDTYELKSIIGEGYRGRYYEYLLVKDPDVREALERNSIYLVGWRDAAEALEK